MAETYTPEHIDEMVDQLLADMPPASVDAKTFLGEQFDRGLAWVHFPEGCGGLGASLPASTPATSSATA